ncbi:ASCH domain-containing protein [Planctomycetota bacterium]|nr:ASCH domain-containing protein [Planctomycetota bacterium]
MGKAHIAILKKKYMDMILSGEKTIESRITKTGCAPYGRIEVGDRIYLKISSGPFVGITKAVRIEQYHHLNGEHIMKLYEQFDDQVCGGKKYWEGRKDCRFATFIWLGEVEPIDVAPRYTKSMKAWHIIQEANCENKNISCSTEALDRLSALNRGTVKSEQTDEIKQEHGCEQDWTVSLSAGAIRNGYIRMSKDWQNQITDGMTLLLPNNELVETDIAHGRGMIRWRGWSGLFERYNMQVGDEARFVSQGGGRYRVLFVKQDAAKKSLHEAEN